MFVVSGDSSYGFIEKVLEGITVRINSIKLNFTSAVFKAEVQVSDISSLKKKSNLHYTGGITPKSYEWRVHPKCNEWWVHLIVSDLTDPGIVPMAFRADSDVFSLYIDPSRIPEIAVHLRGALS